MQSSLPLTLYCISLLSLQQLQALPAQERPGTSRLDLLNKLIDQREDTALASGGQTNIAVPSSAPSQSLKWLSSLLRHPPASGVRTASPSLAWAKPADASQIERSAPRARRHAHSGSRGVTTTPNMPS